MNLVLSRRFRRSVSFGFLAFALSTTGSFAQEGQAGEGGQLAVDESEAKRRGICGLSLGGTFALYAFATRPDAFTFHAAVSSALWFDDGRVIDDLKSLAPGSRQGASAFISVGSQEIPEDASVCTMMVEGSRAAAQEIERIGAPVILAVSAGENHQSTIIATMPQIMREAARRM